MHGAETSCAETRPTPWMVRKFCRDFKQFRPPSSTCWNFRDPGFLSFEFWKIFEQMNADPFYKLYKDAGIVPIEVLTNGIVALICFAGIGLNSALVYATIKSKSLRSTCQILIAIYAIFVSFLLIGYSVKFFVFLFGINYITLELCGYIQFVPLVGSATATTLQLCIGVDRLAGVSCPIWYKSGGRFTTFKVIICFCIVTSVIKLFFIYHFGSSQHWQTPVMCTLGDPARQPETIAAGHVWTLITYWAEFFCYFLIWVISWCRKANETNNGRRLLLSLTVIMAIGLICYVGNSMFAQMVMPSLDVFTIEYIIDPICHAFYLAAYSSTTPVFLLCSRDYRRAFRTIYMAEHHATQVHVIQNNLNNN